MTLIQCLSLGQFKTYLISTFTNTMATVHSREEEVAERIEAILKSLVLHEKLNFCLQAIFSNLVFCIICVLCLRISWRFQFERVARSKVYCDQVEQSDFFYTFNTLMPFQNVTIKIMDPLLSLLSNKIDFLVQNQR